MGHTKAAVTNTNASTLYLFNSLGVSFDKAAAGIATLNHISGSSWNVKFSFNCFGGSFDKSGVGIATLSQPDVSTKVIFNTVSQSELSATAGLSNNPRLKPRPPRATMQ